nr:immunoglobulin heavy chain junction region [Mus musculus]
CARNWYYFDYW